MKYPSEIRELKIDNVTFRLLELVDVEALFEELVAMDPDHEHLKDERIPYWAELWPSAIGLAKHLLQSQVVHASTKVMEIGCGLGLPGIVAGKLNANVTFTDYVEDALEMAAENWKLNIPASGNVEFLRLDWREPNADLATDVLLASDVAYEKRAFEPLLKMFDVMVKPGGTILLSEPGRKYAGDFFHSLDKAGYRINQFSYPVLLKGVNTIVGVYEIKKPLETKQLLFREFIAADAEKIFELNNDPEITKHTGETPFKDLEEALRWIHGENIHHAAGYGRYAVELKETGEFIGWCGIKKPENEDADIGFRFLKKFWGHGYATEAVIACLESGFNQAGLDKIFARVLKANIASVHVLEKAGMKNPKEVVLHNAAAFVYSMTKEQWNVK